MDILLLTDYRNSFYSSIKNSKTLCTMNVERIMKYFEASGFNVTVSEFSKIDPERDYEGMFILYTSSEDRGLKYRSYIEDVVLFLKERGAILIPDFSFLRAHHNKCFMELLRYKLLPEQAEILKSKVFGTFEELNEVTFAQKKYVLKSSFGAGSRYVKLADNKEEIKKIAKGISRTTSVLDIANECRRRLFWRGYHKSSINKEKFIIQNYIDGLSGDFKVLKYGNRFYTLYRKNRENDFRASGGGRLSFDIPNNVDELQLVEFAKKISDAISTPLCSMDIAWDGKKFILIEFQCLNFGTYTAENSEKYFQKINGSWKTFYEKCDLEKVFCDAIIDYIKHI